MKLLERNDNDLKGRGTDEQGNWILGFGPWLRVLKPRELQDEVGLLVQECARLYRRTLGT